MDDDTGEIGCPQSLSVRSPDCLNGEKRKVLGDSAEKVLEDSVAEEVVGDTAEEVLSDSAEQKQPEYFGPEHMYTVIIALVIALAIALTLYLCWKLWKCLFCYGYRDMRYANGNATFIASEETSILLDPPHQNTPQNTPNTTPSVSRSHDQLNDDSLDTPSESDQSSGPVGAIDQSGSEESLDSVSDSLPSSNEDLAKPRTSLTGTEGTAIKNNQIESSPKEVTSPTGDSNEENSLESTEEATENDCNESTEEEENAAEEEDEKAAEEEANEEEDEVTASEEVDADEEDLGDKVDRDVIHPPEVLFGPMGKKRCLDHRYVLGAPLALKEKVVMNKSGET